MGFRFRKSIKIAPGVKVNLGKKGTSVTVGNKYGRATLGKNRTTVSSSLPGTGLSYSKQYNKKKKKSSVQAKNSGCASMLLLTFLPVLSGIIYFII